MSTAMRNPVVTRFGEPISRDHRTAPTRRSAGATFLDWAATHPGLTSIGLSLVYLVTLAALVAVLAASALATPLGAVVGVLFVVEVLVYVAIAAYIVTPEHKVNA